METLSVQRTINLSQISVSSSLDWYNNLTASGKKMFNNNLINKTTTLIAVFARIKFTQVPPVSTVQLLCSAGGKSGDTYSQTLTNAEMNGTPFTVSFLMRAPSSQVVAKVTIKNPNNGVDISSYATFLPPVSGSQSFYSLSGSVSYPQADDPISLSQLLNLGCTVTGSTSGEVIGHGLISYVGSSTVSFAPASPNKIQISDLSAIRTAILTI